MSNTTPRAPTHTAIQVPSTAALFDTAHCAGCHRFTLYRRTQICLSRVHTYPHIVARAFPLVEPSLSFFSSIIILLRPRNTRGGSAWTAENCIITRPKHTTMRQRLGQVALCQSQSGGGYDFNEKENEQLRMTKRKPVKISIFFFLLVTEKRLNRLVTVKNGEFTIIRIFKKDLRRIKILKSISKITSPVYFAISNRPQVLFSLKNKFLKFQKIRKIFIIFR